MKIPTGHEWISLTVPKIWENDNGGDEWYSGYTPDRTVWISAASLEELTNERLKGWLPGHLWMFGVKVDFDWDTLHSAPGRIGEWSITDYFVSGQTEDGACEVSICVYDLDAKRRFIVTSGGPPAKRQEHHRAIESILASIKRIPAPPGYR